jgi:hypothetical protein
MLAFPPALAPVDAELPSGTAISSEIDGRWRCQMTILGGGHRRQAAGVLDLVQVGDYLAGRARCAGVADVAPGTEGLDARLLGLEGPLFGSVQGDQVVMWVTEVFGQAMWVMEGSIASAGIAGTAVYTDHAGGDAVRIEARFVMRRG